MPDLDLKPDDYRVRDPKNGRWFQRDSRPALIIGIVFGLAFIAFIWWRTPEPTGTTLLLVALIGVCVGGLVGRLTKDIY